MLDGGGTSVLQMGIRTMGSGWKTQQLGALTGLGMSPMSRSLSSRIANVTAMTDHGDADTPAYQH